MNDADGMASGRARRVRPYDRWFAQYGIIAMSLLPISFTIFLAVWIPWFRLRIDASFRERQFIDPGARERFSARFFDPFLPEEWGAKLFLLIVPHMFIIVGFLAGIAVAKAQQAYVKRRLDAFAEDILAKKGWWDCLGLGYFDMFLTGPSVVAATVTLAAIYYESLTHLYSEQIVNCFIPFTLSFCSASIALRPIHQMIIARADEIAAAEAAAAAQKA